MRVLVTGATGFVGACVARRMVQIGHEVHVTVRQGANLWRLADLQSDLRMHVCDLRDSGGVAGLVASVRPDAIFHLATYGGFADQQDSLAIVETNFIGTMNLVRACEAVDYTCFINTGSSSEYGIKDRPMQEGDLLEPLGDYGVTKAATTLFCRSEALAKGLPLATFRLFSPYGPWDDPKRLIPYVIRAKLQGCHPRLSNPAFVRDYVYIDDVVAAYEMVLQRSVIPGWVINIGSGVQSSIGTVVSCIDRLLPNCSAEWGAAAPRKSEPACWVADISRAATLLEWRPHTLLSEGLDRTASWMRENIHFY